MSKFISKNRIDKHLIENVLGISTEAKAAKAKDPSVINTTAGTYYDDNSKLHLFKCVEDHFKNCNYNNSLSYSSVVGYKNLEDILFPWVIGEDYKDIFKNYNFKAIATPGGTGALSMAFCNYSEKDKYVLLPDLRWPSYEQIANTYDLHVINYSLFNKEGNFNIYSIDEKLKEIMKSQNNILIVINDPCHNPTGYSMSEEEYDSLINVLNKHAENTFITLLIDVAYLDYGFDYGNKSRNNFKKLVNLSNNVQVLFAFSASKTFGIYGLRLGALLHLSKDVNESNDFIDTGKFFARTTWSNTNHFAIDLLTDTLLYKERKEEFIQELKSVSRNLLERGNLLISILDEYHVPHAKYSGGFFVLIFVNDSKFLNEVKLNKVYACEMGGGLRIAVSSINKEEVVRLGHILGNAYQNIIK